MVVIASTRPGRLGLPIANWFVARARQHAVFELDVVDLLELNLPMLDEPNHPRLQRYVHEHTKAWSARVDRADAFVFVMPEYNFSFTAPLKNALDYLSKEWANKPVGIVSYGGVSAGTRASAAIRPVFGSLKLVPVGVNVSVPFARGRLDDAGVVQANDVMNDAASKMLDDLVLMERTLRPLRRA